MPDNVVVRWQQADKKPSLTDDVSGEVTEIHSNTH
jgi:hypothetical protein